MSEGETAKQVLAVIGVFGTPVIIVISVLLYKWMRERELHRTIRALVERGQPLPPELFQEREGKKSPLHNGVLLVAIGLGLIIMFLNGDDPQQWGIGAIPLLVGLGYLLVWRLENRPRA